MTRVNLSVVSQLDSQLLSRWGIDTYKTLAEAIKATKKDNGKIGIVQKGADTLLVPAVK
jgi:hypothetical protein